MAAMPSRSRHISLKVRARVVELRTHHPWLGLRKIASALKLSLHQVRQAIEEPVPAQRLTGRPGRVRCGTCGAKLAIVPCHACKIQAAKAG